MKWTNYEKKKTEELTGRCWASLSVGDIAKLNAVRNTRKVNCKVDRCNLPGLLDKVRTMTDTAVLVQVYEGGKIAEVFANELGADMKSKLEAVAGRKSNVKLTLIK